MSKNLKDLQEKRNTLEAEVLELQKTNATQVFNVTLDDVKMVKTIQDHLNKGYTWKTQNAAVIVTLYDRLTEEKKRLKAEETEDVKPVLKLKAHELNGLYQALLNVEGLGVENARRFIRMLTNVGESVTLAMKELSELNKEVTDMHLELNELDKEIEEASKAPEEVKLEEVND